MRATLLLCVALMGACQVLQPELDKNGYVACENDGQCESAGRTCQSGFCSPPPWWKPEYGFRRQLKFTNVSEFTLPKGFPVRVPVGADPRPLKPDEVTPNARFVQFDRANGAQVEMAVTVDVVNAVAFDVVMQLPVELGPGTTWADLWIYSAGNGVGTRPDARKDVYPLDDTFEDMTLDATRWKTEGPATFVPGDGEVTLQRNGYLWTTLEIPGTPGAMFTVLFSVTPVDTCQGLTIGLIHNALKSYATPYVVAESSGSGNLTVTALRADNFPTEPPSPEPALMGNTTQRLDVLVSGVNVRSSLNGLPLENFTMLGAITQTLRGHIFVEGGACTLSVKQARMRAAVDPEPTLELGGKIKRPE